jgi:hypothetical protein
LPTFLQSALLNLQQQAGGGTTAVLQAVREGAAQIHAIQILTDISGPPHLLMP